MTPPQRSNPETKIIGYAIMPRLKPCALTGSRAMAEDRDTGARQVRHRWLVQFEAPLGQSAPVLPAGPVKHAA